MSNSTPRFTATRMVLVIAALLLAPVAGAQVEPEEVLRLREQAQLRVRTPARAPIFAPPPTVPREDIDPVVLGLVDRLEDPSFEAREKATEELRTHRCPDSHLYAALDQLGLSNEQRQRLVAALRTRILSKRRGALGVQLSTGGPTIEIRTVFPDMPAEEVLRVGDIITHLGGDILPSTSALITAVQKRQPGDTINLTVERPERDETGRIPVGVAVETERMEVTLTLGDAERLDDFNDGRPRQVSEVQRELMAAASALTNQYRPQVRPVVFLDGMSGSLFGDPAIPLQELVIQDPILRKLQKEVQMVQRGELLLTGALRRQWVERLQHLDALVREPGLTESERELRLAIVTRYQRLLQKAAMVGP